MQLLSIITAFAAIAAAVPAPAPAPAAVPDDLKDFGRLLKKFGFQPAQPINQFFPIVGLQDPTVFAIQQFFNQLQQRNAFNYPFNWQAPLTNQFGLYPEDPFIQLLQRMGLNQYSPFSQFGQGFPGLGSALSSNQPGFRLGKRSEDESPMDELD